LRLLAKTPHVLPMNHKGGGCAPEGASAAARDHPLTRKSGVTWRDTG
jgi:hypothetical protein